MLDLTVVSIPVYFGTMAAEHGTSEGTGGRARAHAGDYTGPDTATSLAMGMGSLIAPLVMPKLVRHVVPGKGKYGKVLVGAARRRRGSDLRGRPSRRRRPPTTNPDRPDTARRRRLGRLARRDPQDHRSGRRRSRHTGRQHHVRDADQPRQDVAEGRGATTAAPDPSPGRPPSPAGTSSTTGTTGSCTRSAACGPSTSSTTRASATTSPPPCGSPWPTCSASGCPTGSWPACGVRPYLISQARAINLLYQYWIHTETIRTLGPAEEVLNTPSHHRVHHG